MEMLSKAHGKTIDSMEKERSETKTKTQNHAYSRTTLLFKHMVKEMDLLDGCFFGDFYSA
jgi:hypothetical protein